MADDIQGGLNAVNQSVEETPIVEEAPAVQELSKEAAYKETSLEKLRRQQLIYDQTLQKMIDSLGARQGRPSLDRELAALGAELSEAPYFATGFSKGVAKMADVRALDEQRKLEEQKIKFDLLGSQMGITKEQYALEKEQEGKQFLRDVMSGKIGQDGAPIKATTLAGSTKMTVPDAYALIDSAQTTGKRITPAMLAAAPNKETRDFLEKMYDNQQKEAELEQKEFGSTKITLPVIGEPTENITVKQAKEIERLDRATRDMPIEERTAIFNQYYQDKGILGRRAVVSSTGKTTEQFETPQQRATRVAGETETVKETAKSNVKDIEFLETRRDSAVDQINDAKAVYSIATNPQTKNAFGILSRPGVASAFGELVREPLKFGDISVGVSNIENIIRKAGGTQEEINAAAIVARNIAKLELGFSQAFKGQGQVSDNERLIVRNVGPQISDNPKVAALKAESIIARAEFDSGLATKFAQWQESHPNGTVRQFKGSPEYNTVKTGYDNKLGNILSKYGMTPARVETEKSTLSPKKGGSLWEAIQNAKESE
jgi:hypothetical protein